MLIDIIGIAFNLANDLIIITFLQYFLVRVFFTIILQNHFYRVQDDSFVFYSDWTLLMLNGVVIIYKAESDKCVFHITYKQDAILSLLHYNLLL